LNVRRIAIVAGPLALAAAVFVWVAGGRDGDSARAPVPDYALAAISDPADTNLSRLRLHAADAPFEIALRPAAPAGKVVAYAFAMGEGEPNPIEANVEIAPDGTIRIRGRARALEGAREVRVVIGTAQESIKRFDDALARARDGKSDAKVRVLTVAIVRD
jgi:hypothetical protein